MNVRISRHEEAAALQTVGEILSFLTARSGEDFNSYARTLAGKRIAERARRLGVARLADYLDLLRCDPAEPELLGRMLRIRFSCFFRDPLQFEFLGGVILPAMLEDRRAPLRAWSAACACGEEPYSLAVMLDEAGQLGAGPAAQIFATDVAEDALEEARRGSYQAESLAGVTLKRLGQYFVRAGSEYRVVEALARMVTFSRHDLLDRRTYVPPESLFGGFDLVLCRNFLMYLAPDAYLRVFDKLFRSLNPGGVLMLGKAETVPERYAGHLERVVDFGQIYRKRR